MPVFSSVMDEAVMEPLQEYCNTHPCISVCKPEYGHAISTLAHQFTGIQGAIKQNKDVTI
jgi:hypothetical protein